jgi:signal peptidase I
VSSSIGAPAFLAAAAAAAAAVAVAVAVRRRVVAATVRGSSMTPTFDDGDRVYAVRRARYRVGDVVVFDVGSQRLAADPGWRIKRVTAVAGDPAPDWAATAGRTVPPGSLVVEGDNPVSQGSRQLGYVPTVRVLGAVLRLSRVDGAPAGPAEAPATASTGGVAASCRRRASRRRRRAPDR